MNNWFRSLVISIILAIIFTWFALSNSQIVNVSILIWSFQVSLSLVILISILIGVIITGLISAMEQARMLGKIKELEKNAKTEESK
jgi:lipopolysaccharide assembly protein A